MPKEQRDDIIFQYEEHFDIELSSGKNEDTIIQELGDPHIIITRYGTTNDISSSLSNIVETDTFNRFKSKTSSPEESNHYTSANLSTQSNGKSIFSTIVIILLLLFLSPVIFGLTTGMLFAFGAAVITPLIMTFFSILLFFGKALNTGNFKNIFHPAIDQIPVLSTVLFAIGNIALSILSIIIVFQLLKLFGKIVKKFFNWLKQMFI